MTTSVQNQYNPIEIKERTSLNENFLDDIGEKIQHREFSKALDRLLLLFLDIQENTPENLIEKIYSYLKVLTPHSNFEQIKSLREEAFDKLNLFPSLYSALIFI